MEIVLSVIAIVLSVVSGLFSCYAFFWTALRDRKQATLEAYNQLQEQALDHLNFYMPSEIAKQTGLRTTQISNALRDLKERDLVVCLNETARKGRIYQNTPLGLEILKRIEK